MTELDAVERAAQSSRAAREEMLVAIRRAVAAGHSLNEVAGRAGLSRQRVWQITKEDQR